MDSSGWDEDFVLELSTDDEGSDRVDPTDDVENKEQVLQDSKNTFVSPKTHHYARKDLGNYYDDLKVDIKKQENDISDEESKRNSPSEYLIFPKYSPMVLKKSDPDLNKEDICDKIVDFSKLVNQLFNARVVIERLFENPKRDVQSGKKCVSSSKKRLLDSIQRYCPDCKTIEVDTHNYALKKSCPKCETSMLYHCPKCKNKVYTKVQSLRTHWKKCEVNADSSSTFADSPISFRKTKREIARSRIQRFCSSCNESIANNENSKAIKCKKCEQNSLHQCKKCKKQFNSHHKLLCHKKSNCSPAQRYKCNECDKTHDTQSKLRDHITRVHCSTKTHCSKSNKYFINKSSYTSHLSYCRRKLEVNCNYFLRSSPRRNTKDVE